MNLWHGLRRSRMRGYRWLLTFLALVFAVASVYTTILYPHDGLTVVGKIVFAAGWLTVGGVLLALACLDDDKLERLVERAQTFPFR